MWSDVARLWSLIEHGSKEDLKQYEHSIPSFLISISFGCMDGIKTTSSTVGSKRRQPKHRNFTFY